MTGVTHSDASIIIGTHTRACGDRMVRAVTMRHSRHVAGLHRRQSIRMRRCEKIGAEELPRIFDDNASGKRASDCATAVIQRCRRPGCGPLHICDATDLSRLLEGRSQAKQQGGSTTRFRAARHAIAARNSPTSSLCPFHIVETVLALLRTENCDAAARVRCAALKPLAALFARLQGAVSSEEQAKLQIHRIKQRPWFKG